MSDTPIRLLGLVGSLRTGSINRGLLEAVFAEAPAGVTGTIFEGLREIPPYDPGLDVADHLPPSVAALRTAIAEADGLVIASPEYNYSIPGVLKNALDWASRPPATAPLRQKPTGILGASTGISGTIRMQHHLRQVLQFSDTYVMQRPEVILPKAASLFDAQGHLTDASTRELVRTWTAALAAWVRRMKG